MIHHVFEKDTVQSQKIRLLFKRSVLQRWAFKIKGKSKKTQFRLRKKVKIMKERKKTRSWPRSRPRRKASFKILPFFYKFPTQFSITGLRSADTHVFRLHSGLYRRLLFQKREHGSKGKKGLSNLTIFFQFANLFFIWVIIHIFTL